MEKIIERIKTNWYKNPGAELQGISKVENNLNIQLPNDYKTFIIWSNGGEGEVGENYLYLWKIEEIMVLNNEYQIQKYLSGDFLAIGTDGGGICYGFNLKDNFSVFKCPLGDLDINEMSLIAKSFKDFLEKATVEEV